MGVADRERSEPSAEERADRLPGTTAAPSLAGLALTLQRRAGNRATRRALSRANGATKAQPATLSSLVMNRDIAGIVALKSYWGASEIDRRDAIELIVSKPKLSAAEKDAVKRLWDAQGSHIDRELAVWPELWFRCRDRGVKLDAWHWHDDIDLWFATGPEVITTFQADRVPDAVRKLSRGDYRLLRLDLYLADTRKQKAYLLKALAAGRTMRDVDKFSDAIRGKDDKWLADHLNVVEEEPIAKTGPGIRQQWQMSCGPTSVQVLHAQTDPIYALGLTGGGDITQLGKNPLIKKEQGKILKGHGSVPTEVGTAGTGAWVESDFNALRIATGVTYVWTPVKAKTPTNPWGGDMDKALTKIKAWLKDGIYIPIVIGAKPGDTAHYNVILRYSSAWGFLVHDPAQAYSAWVTTLAFMNNNLSPPLAWSTLAGYDTPKKKKK